MTLRRALGEHPTCPSKRRRLKNSLSVSAPTPRLRPNTNSVATTRRISQARPAIHGLEVSMYAAFGKPGAIRQAPDALLAVFTNRVENDNTLGPQSHGVGPCSARWLKLEKSALQSTRSTAGCPALRGCPSSLWGACMHIGL